MPNHAVETGPNTKLHCQPLLSSRATSTSTAITQSTSWYALPSSHLRCLNVVVSPSSFMITVKPHPTGDQLSGLLSPPESGGDDIYKWVLVMETLYPDRRSEMATYVAFRGARRRQHTLVKPTMHPKRVQRPSFYNPLKVFGPSQTLVPLRRAKTFAQRRLKSSLSRPLWMSSTTENTGLPRVSGLPTSISAPSVSSTAQTLRSSASATSLSTTAAPTQAPFVSDILRGSDVPVLATGQPTDSSSYIASISLKRRPTPLPKVARIPLRDSHRDVIIIS